jgi:hypothetical protein
LSSLINLKEIPTPISHGLNSYKNLHVSTWYRHCKLATSHGPNECSQVHLNLVILWTGPLLPIYSPGNLASVTNWECIMWQNTVLHEPFWFTLKDITSTGINLSPNMWNDFPVTVWMKQNGPLTFVSQIKHHTTILSAVCCLLLKNQCGLSFDQYLRFCLLTSPFT